MLLNPISPFSFYVNFLYCLFIHYDIYFLTNFYCSLIYFLLLFPNDAKSITIIIFKPSCLKIYLSVHISEVPFTPFERSRT